MRLSRRLQLRPLSIKNTLLKISSAKSSEEVWPHEAQPDSGVGNSREFIARSAQVIRSRKRMVCKSKFRIAATTLLGILIVTHVAPLSMGLSFCPLPYGPYADSAAMKSARKPATLTGVDNLTFPQVDWPWRKVERNFITAGELPLWNPYASLGLPLGPQYQNQLFLPLEWVEILGGPRLWNTLLVLKIFLAGVGAMLLAQRFCSATPAIMAGGLFYAYSSYFLWFNAVPAFVNGAMAAPWLFLAIAALFEEQRSDLRKTGQLALVIGFIWLCGQPQISIISSLAAGLLFVCYWIATPGQRSRTLSLAVCGTILGFFIAAPQLWSFADALGRGYSLHPPGSYSNYGTPPLNFILTIWPFLLGQLMWAWDTQLYPDQLNWEGFPLVVGTSGFLLSMLGLTLFVLPPRKGRRPLLLSGIVAIGLSSFFIIICASAGWSFWKPPGLDRVNFPRYVGPVLSLYVASTCAWGIENLRRASFRELLAPPILLLICASLAGSVVWSITAGGVSKIDPTYFRYSIVLGIAPCALVLLSWCAIVFVWISRKIEVERMVWAVVIIAAGELMFFVRLGFSVSDELLRLIPLGLFCIAAVVLVLRHTWIASATLAIGLTGSVGILIFAQDRLAPVYDPYLDPPRHIEFLKSVAGWREGAPRILSTQVVMEPNVGNAFALSELASRNPLQIDRTARVILDLLATEKLDYTIPNMWPGMTHAPGPLSWAEYLTRRPIYNALAVTYLVDAPSGPLSKNEDRSIELVYGDGNVAIYRDHLAMPRAYLINAVRPVGNFDEALTAMRDPQFEPHTQAIVEALPAELPATITGNSHGRIIGLPIVYFGSTRIDIDLGSRNEGLVVLADAYDVGWNAEIDGQPRSVFAVNGALRGVLIGPEDKTLTFRFSPPGFYPSLILALLAFVLSIALCFRCRISAEQYIK